MANARFKVDPRLASLLGEGYRSSEEALRELVDNAWDADAEHVRITLPRELTTDPIVVGDDGTGMTDKEVREEYLYVANDRRSRKGERTTDKRRKVKGRKGIGKFAGLMAAESMTVETRANGRLTRLRITKADLVAVGAKNRDLEGIDLPIETENCEPAEHGTQITLSGLSQTLTFPSADRLKQLLILEYGRQPDFAISVNGDAIAIDDIPGERVEGKICLPGVGEVRIKFTIAEGKKGLKQSGIAVRVGGKLVGRPMTLGLEEDETIPAKLLKRVYGEIEADGLADDVTADWGAIVENSKPFRDVKMWAAEQVGTSVKTTFKQEVNLQKGRLKQQVGRRLAKLPENRRRAAEDAINRVLQRFYGESEERIDVVVSVMLDAFERDEYWVVLQKLNDATRGDVAKLADVLGEFGIVDLAVVGQQTRQRLAFLDELERLVANPQTLEAQVHQAIERNLWVLGADFALIASNTTLRKLLGEWAGREFVGKRAKKRPDLFLAQDLQQRHVLIEFKRPSHDINRDDETQAIKYRDDLARYTAQAIEIVLMGRARATAISPQYNAPALRAMSYAEVVSSARTQLQWLLAQLGAELDDAKHAESGA
ncbi:MAG: ATP-binding protein [Myxococcales bacterium]|nr:ATP-binding protein [Myxococcales bacterium]